MAKFLHFVSLYQRGRDQLEILSPGHVISTTSHKLNRNLTNASLCDTHHVVIGVTSVIIASGAHAPPDTFEPPNPLT